MALEYALMAADGVLAKHLVDADQQMMYVHKEKHKTASQTMARQEHKHA